MTPMTPVSNAFTSSSRAFLGADGQRRSESRSLAPHARAAVGDYPSLRRQAADHSPPVVHRCGTGRAASQLFPPELPARNRERLARTHDRSAADADVGQVAAKCGLNQSGSAACCTLWE